MFDRSDFCCSYFPDNVLSASQQTRNKKLSLPGTSDAQVFSNFSALEVMSVLEFLERKLETF